MNKTFKCALLTIFAVLLLSSFAHGYSDFFRGYSTDRTLYLAEPPLEGEDVLELQERLKELNFYNGELDGIYGPKTYEAVKSLQKEAGKKVTGEVGPETWSLLGGEDVHATTVTSEEKPSGDLSILIDTNKKELTVLNNGEIYQTFPCAVGKAKTPTPVGEWKIVHKGGNWGGGFGVRWMGLNVPWGIFGIHGTNKPYSIGTPASHGCIRMYNEDVRTLYSWIPQGTPVKIVGEPIMPPQSSFRSVMGKGAVGPDVVQVQLRLKEKGYLFGRADGRYGAMTELGVKFFQVRNGIEATGEVKEETYKALGIK